MMIKIFLISASILASANGGWAFENNDNNRPGVRIPRMAAPQFPNIPNFPNFPAFPGMPNFANLFPKIEFPNIEFPKIQMPNIPSPEEIASHNEPGYTGMSVISTSDGGTTVTINEGGKIKTYTVPKGSSNTKTSTSTLIATSLNN